MLSEIFTLIKKEFTLEWRTKSSMAGMVVYILSSIFISYLSFKSIVDVPTWNALFWLLILFAAVNSVAKSFLSESRGVQLFYYTFLNPQSVIFSKIIYNGSMLFILSLITFAAYTIFLGNPVQNILLFFVTLLIGCFGLSSVLTMISSIASKAGQQSTFMAILGFPVLLPLLMMLIRLSKNAIDGIEMSANYQYIVLLVALNIMIPALAFILFPYLWRE
jgi:heme exporter protein B